MDSDNIEEVKKRLNFRYDSPAEILERNSPVEDNAPPRASSSQTTLEDAPESSTATRSRARRNSLMPPPHVPAGTTVDDTTIAHSHPHYATRSRIENNASQNPTIGTPTGSGINITAPPLAVASTSVATERTPRPPELSNPLDTPRSRRQEPTPKNPAATPRVIRRSSMGPPPLPTRRNVITRRPSEHGITLEEAASRREELGRVYLSAVSMPVGGSMGTMGPPPTAASTSATMASARPLEGRSGPADATVTRSAQTMSLATPRRRSSMGPPPVPTRLISTIERARPDTSTHSGTVQNPVARAEHRGAGTLGPPPTAASTSATTQRPYYSRATHEFPTSYMRREPIPITIATSGRAVSMGPPPAPMSTNAPPERVHCPPDCSCRTRYHCPPDCVCRVNDAHIPALAQTQSNKRRRSSSPGGDSSVGPAPDISHPPTLFAPVARHAIPDLDPLIDPTQTSMQATESAAGSASGWTWRAPPAGLYMGFHNPDHRPSPAVEVEIEPVEEERPQPAKRRRLDEDEDGVESGPSSSQSRPGPSHQ